MPQLEGVRHGSGAAQSFFAEALVVGAVLLWWTASINLDSAAFPSPPQVGRAMLELAADPRFWLTSLATVARILIAITLAMLIGGLLALLPRYWPEFGVFVNDRVRPVLNSFPSVGWALLGSVWFGVSWTAVIFVQTAILIPFTMINIGEGLREIGREEQEMARSFTRNRWRGLKLVIFPLLYPYLLAAVRISYGVAWKVSLVAELFGARVGLGTMIQDAQTNNRVDVVFAVCLFIVLYFAVGEKFVLEPMSRLFHARAADGRRT